MPKTNHKRRFHKPVSRNGKAPGGGVPKFAFPDQPEVAKVWDPTKTLKANYESIGLTLKVNKQIEAEIEEKQREKLAKLEGVAKPTTKKPKKKDLLVVGEEAPAFEPQMSDSVGSYYERLMQKHGTDYAAMARDIKLNTWQHTKRKLQKECERLLAQRAAQKELAGAK